MQPTDIHKQFATHFKNKDLAGLMSLFHERAVFVPGKGRQLLTSKQAIAEELQNYLTNQSQSIETTSTSVYQTGATALIVSKWKIAAGDKVIEGQAIEVLIKENDCWLYLIDNPYGV